MSKDKEKLNPVDDLDVVENEQVNKASESEELKSRQAKATEKGADETLKMAKKLDELRSELEAQKKKVHDAEDKSLRIYAEMENLRRRTERDMENAHKFALEKCLKELIPVIDSMEQATQTQGKDDAVNAMRQGIELTMKMLIDTLAKFGVEQISPEGEVFDPQLHEAMSMQVNNEVDANTVIAVFQKGYALNQRVIRPARVVVSKQA